MAPSNWMEEGIRFFDKELAPRGVNTMILQVDHHCQFPNHRELKDWFEMSKENAARQRVQEVHRIRKPRLQV